MADVITRFKLETSQYDSKLRDTAKGLKDIIHLHELAGKDFKEFSDSQIQAARSLGQMATGATNAKDKVKELVASYNDMAKTYNMMSEAMQKSEGGKALAASLQELQARIKEAKAEMNATPGVLDKLASKFVINIDAIKLFNMGLKAADAALGVAKDAFFQSETNIDEWGRTLKGAEGAYQVFLDTLNNGNWSNFFSNLETAIRGGRDLYDIFDRLGSIKSNNAAAIAIVQQQIAQLRLAKQQGENVDTQLKAATARLAQLQGQAVTAGKEAGSKAAFNVIRNGVNSIGGAHVNDATIKLAVSQLMTGGQAQFDKFRNNRDILHQRGMVTRTQTIVDSQGGTYQRQYKEFDINALSREQQKQYALALAITKGETRIQEGIAAFAQAVNEGTASAREEFKGNRYALQGSHGGGSTTSGRGSGGKVVVATDPYAGMFQGGPALTSGLAVGMISGNPRESMRMGWGLDYWTRQRYNQATEKAMRKGGGDEKQERTNQEMLQGVDTMVGSLGSIVSGIENLGIELPRGLSDILGAMQTIIGIVGAIQAMQQVGTWLGLFSRGGVVHAATGMIVPGNNMSGDRVPAMLNSGELVLSQFQQQVLAANLQASGMQNLHLEASVHGEQIVLAVNNTMKRMNKGELATFR